MSESIFDKPLNGDLEALSSSAVKSINGKKPDPITGDITVIEGGGSGSYGAYRLDTTIPVSSWSGSGPYTVTIINELIKSTMDGKSWLDNDTALLGETTLTSQDGSLLISTTVKPTEDWVLHVSFALNGADVLADSEEQKKAIGKIIPVITGTTNNSGYTINSGDYFEANGNLYKASATIPTNESWSSSSDALPTSALSDIHAKMGAVGNDSLQSQINSLNSNLNSKANATNDILADAVSVNGTKFFNGSGSAYTGVVPNSNYGYGIFIVMSRWSNKFVFAHSADNETAVNYYNGSSWIGWQRIVSSSKARDAVFAVYMPSVTFTNGIATISVTKETFGYEKIRCPIAMISSSSVTSYSVNSCDMINSNTTLRICLNNTSINATLNIFVHYSAY